MILTYIVLIVGISFYPAPFKFMEPAVCPPGMTFDEETAKQNRGRRNSYAKCRSESGEIVDVTGRLLLVGLIPFSTGLLFILFSVRTKTLPKEESRRQAAVFGTGADERRKGE